MILEVNHLNKAFDNKTVIKDLSLDFSGEGIYCFFGPSGCGKTTLLNLMTGLLPPDSGEIIGFQDRTHAYIFQENRLLPWASVEENLAFVLQDIDKEEVPRRIETALSLVEMERSLSLLPHQLSGGMKQRVAIARAIAYAGDILMMDEPFKGLHWEIKLSVMKYIQQYWQEKKGTGFLVTHDVEEVLYMADHVYVVEGPPLKVIHAFTIDLPHCDREKELSKMKGYRKLLRKK